MILCEFITGGGLALTPAPTSQLAHEAELMLRALAYDLEKCFPNQTYVCRDARLSANGFDRIITMTAGCDPWDAWRHHFEKHRVAWLIAPESDRTLERLTQLALDANCTIWQSMPSAIQITANKYKTAMLLKKNGVSVVEGALGKIPIGTRNPDDLWVAKPNDGAGSEECRVFHKRTLLLRYLAEQEKKATDYLVQPYISGKSGSLSLLCHADQVILLGINCHHIALEQEKIHIRKIIVNGMSLDKKIMWQLARTVLDSIPGLAGYVGIDFIVTEHGISILEINPRITTSYCGITNSIGTSPIHLLAMLRQGKTLPHIANKNAKPISIVLSE